VKKALREFKEFRDRLARMEQMVLTEQTLLFLALRDLRVSKEFRGQLVRPVLQE
jgi:hypothetical protein